MTSWYSGLLANTSSKITSIRNNLLSSDADGDTDDDTHVCRVLRGYYSEKGRPLPSWLPPDPKAPAPVPQPVLVNNQVGARYGGMGAAPQSAGGLSSLWDNSGAQQQQPQQPQSLRAGRAPASLQPGGGDIQRRPLPSQKAGSYQSAPGNGNPFGGRAEAASVPPGGASSGGGSAQALLRQRLWGGSRTTSPSSQTGSQGPFQPPAAGGGGGGGNYEDRFAPGGMYDQGPGGGGQSGGLRRGGLPSGPRGYR